jgi:hypothetical protein
MLGKNQKNITDLIIGTGAAQNGDGTISVDGLTAGQWALAYENGKIADTDATSALNANPLRFVYRATDGSLIATPFFRRATAKYKASDYSAPHEQVDYIGYVGSGTEAISVINSNDYLVRVIMKGVTAQYGDKLMYKFGAYRSSASATQREIALGLAANLTTNFKRERIQNGEQLVKFEVVTSHAVAVGHDFDVANAVTYTQGSETITVEAGGTWLYNGGTTMVVGDYIRIGALLNAGAVALTDAVYKVIAISGTVATLDRPYEGTSFVDTVNDNQGSEVITAAEAAAALYWGIKCSGIDRSKFKAGWFNYEKIRFELQLQAFGTTIITHSATPTEGNGYYKEVQELEWFFKGNRFNGGMRLGTPPPTFTSDVVTATNYALFTIDYYDASYDGINATPKSPGSVIIAVPTANYAATLTDIGTDWAFTAA